MIDPYFNQELHIKYIVVKTNYNNRAIADIKYCKPFFAAMNEFHHYLSELCSDYERSDDSSSIDDSSDDDNSFENNKNYSDYDLMYIVPTIKFKKNKSVYIIPPTSSNGVKLLYAVHSGYSWIDEDCDKKTYINSNDESDVKKINDIRQKFKHAGIDDSGCFVFDIGNASIQFKDVFFNFLTHLTKAKFCGNFNMRALEEIKYHKKTKTLFCVFDTESG